jgi:hypothetical protein
MAINRDQWLNNRQKAALAESKQPHTRKHGSSPLIAKRKNHWPHKRDRSNLPNLLSGKNCRNALETKMQHNDQDDNHNYGSYPQRCYEPFPEVLGFLRILFFQRVSPSSRTHHSPFYMPGIDGLEGNKPNICKNKNTPIAKLAIQRAAVNRIHFLKFFLGKTPKT